jgi:hypothetical protein
MNRLAIVLGVLILMAGIVYGQAPAAIEAEFNQLHEQIAKLAAANQDIPADIDTRYFELERILYPERTMRIPDGNLDQGSTYCPGAALFQPMIGSDTTSLFDWGRTVSGGSNTCPWTTCGRGPDVYYTLYVSRADCVMISTCGSAFNTKLCVYKEDPDVPGYECCNPAYIYACADSSVGTCDATASVNYRAVLATCFTPGTYHIVLDGSASTSFGTYHLEIRFFNNDCTTPHNDPECPENFFTHDEVASPNEEPCGVTTLVTSCPQGYCGIIDGLGDLDVYQITLPSSCTGLRAHLWANATENAPGGTGYGMGLNSRLTLFMSSCEAPIAQNGDILNAGITPVSIGADAPLGTDSQLSYGSVAAGTPYYIVVSGDNGTTGPYELLIECYNCINE